MPGNDLFFVYSIFIQNKGQMYLMSLNNVFGSDEVSLSNPSLGDSSGNYIYSKTYKLQQVHRKALDHEDHRCDVRKTEGYTSKCITTFLETTIGCTMNLIGSDLNVEV